MNLRRFLLAACLTLVVVSGAAWWREHQATEPLRAELALLRDEQRELARLRTEHARLVAEEVPAATLERLRTDRAAVLRLRAEIQALQANVEKRERALAAPSKGVTKP